MTYGRDILHGVSRYVRENGPWTVYLEQRSLQDDPPSWLSSWKGDGIIARVGRAATRALRRSGIPLVDLDDQRPAPNRPLVESGHEAIGAMAAHHLMERGFSRFAFFGYPGFAWSKRCRDGFAVAVKEAGYLCYEFRQGQRVNWGHQQPNWEAEVDEVASWIGGLPKPLGLMASNDFRGLQAIDACRRAGVAVPEQVAVIGVDNEVVACELSYPPLSSVIPDCRRIGYEAARLLDQMMQGQPLPTSRIIVPPLGIATRRSTDIMAIADLSVADAIRFIREQASNGISVEDVLEHVLISRSALQRRFRVALGRTIHEVIVDVRIQRVKELLVETELSLPEIAVRSGFTHPEYLSTVFRRETGSTPRDYRRSHTQSVFGNSTAP
jgi:LacI family transcriptional regulator, galactose operon repressor